MIYSPKKHKITIVYSILFSLLLVMFFITPLQWMIYGKLAENLLMIISVDIAVGTVLFIYFSRKVRRRKRIVNEEFPEKWEEILKKDVKYFAKLDKKDKELFRKRMQIFLSEKNVKGIGTEVDDRCRVLVAASAIIPIFSFPDWEYDELSEVLVYPGRFDDEFDYIQKKGMYLGMVGIGSAMIISKPALYDGFKHGKSGSNVGIHEFVHKIDEKDGSIDGIPDVMMNKKLKKQWLDVMKREMNELHLGRSDINPYALTNEAEFFAVTSEYFFNNPKKMKSHHRELYSILRKIYRQDTRMLYRRAIRDVVPVTKRKRQGTKCPCGSQKMFENCCQKKMAE